MSDLDDPIERSDEPMNDAPIKMIDAR